ncbi:Receptor-type adenylate cyclase A [Tetrabaena socialis]|uniref:Receptor-type adenylate cyclase A n=1 Tax=Tetrabaena socialis TaxID=47790 RepID=A0A2J8AEJ0_9CHLO|nr:Receptor-type adenylate cyclase A [Tetrabaena socialis]|eukprot:PNH10934.1 Receptor-type adenylate cyclase A [Tetrabaena socialis]
MYQAERRPGLRKRLDPWRADMRRRAAAALRAEAAGLAVLAAVCNWSAPRAHPPKTSEDGATAPISGWCESFPPGCSYDGIMLAAIWTSFVATAGRQQGAFFDPQTMASRLTGEGMAEALRIFRSLHQYQLEPHPPDCMRLSLALISSRCAFFPVVSTAWKAAVSGSAGFLRGRLGVARLPGSEVVEHPDTGLLVPCTQQLCPFAEVLPMQSPPPELAADDDAAPPSQPPAQPLPPAPAAAYGNDILTDLVAGTPRRALRHSAATGPVQPELKRRLADDSGATGAGATAAALLPALPDRRALVNFAPFLGRGAVSVGISARAPAFEQFAAWRAVSAALSAERMWVAVLDPASMISPVRDSHMSDASMDRWVAAGYDRAAVSDFLSTFRAVVLHPNALTGPRVPGAQQLSSLLAQAAKAEQYTGATEEQLVQALREQLLALFNASDPALQASYWADIGYQPPPSPPRAEPPAPRRPSMTPVQGMATALACIVTVGVLATAFAICLSGDYLRYHPAIVMRMSAAPTYGRKTTLMITDIQDSTRMWEQLDESVMNGALNLHNRCIRQLLPKYGAYECHTEGDSFILAFSSPLDAVQCALEIQVQGDAARALRGGVGCGALIGERSGLAAAGAPPPRGGGGGGGGSGGGPRLGSPPPPALSPPSTGLLPPPPELARSFSIHRRHSAIATLWPGAFQNPNAAYGPAGPSRFLAAEVLQELNANLESLTSAAAAVVQPPAAGGGGGGGRGGGGGKGGGAGAGAEDAPAGRRRPAGVAARGGGGAAAASSVEGLPLAEAAGEAAPRLSPLALVQRSAMSMTQLRDAMRMGGSFTGGGGGGSVRLGGGGGGDFGAHGPQMQALLHAHATSKAQSIAGTAPASPAHPFAAHRNHSATLPKSRTASLLLPCRQQQPGSHSLPLGSSQGMMQRLRPTHRNSGTGYGSGGGAAAAAVAAPLCFRGFRVRIGISSGLLPGRDVIWVKRSGRVAYSGPCMQATRLVSDAGQGGMVLLSGDAWAALQPWPDCLAGVKPLHCGRYRFVDPREEEGEMEWLSPLRAVGHGLYA